MLYGVVTRSYLKGTYEIVLFNKKSVAVTCKTFFTDLWNEIEESGEDLDILYQKYYDLAISVIEEIDYRKWEEVNKQISFPINENGHVHLTTSNIRLVNFDDYVYIP